MELAEKVILNTLGNLTILRDSKNSSVGKKSWSAKREKYTTGSYNEIDISKRAVWTKREIAERGIDMLAFLEERIGGLRISDDEKLKLLFCEDCLMSKIKA